MKIFFKVNKKGRKRGRHKKRRNDVLHHLQEYLWPSIGSRAFLRFMEIKMKRSRGSSHAIALGFAMGAFASFTPFMGLHSLIAIALAIPFGGSAIMAVIGTIVGNPWTFPAIWISSYNLGNFILGRTDVETLPTTFDLAHMWENLTMYADGFLWPMFVGGAPMGALAATFFYIVIYNNLNRYRKSRALFLRERRSKLDTVKYKATALKDKILTHKKDKD